MGFLLLYPAGGNECNVSFADSIIATVFADSIIATVSGQEKAD